MSKLTKSIFVVMVAVIFMFLSVIMLGGSTSAAYAEEITETEENGAETEETGEVEELIGETENEPETPSETPETEEETGSTETETETDVTVNFLEYLKSVYPSNYEYYYNLIIDNWGSVEEYLLSATDYLPESAQNSWEAFVGWLSEYACVWATILAVCAAVIFAYLQYRRTQKYKAQYNTLTEASNQQTTALISVIEAQQALLGNNEKFAEQATALSEAIEELKKNV